MTGRFVKVFWIVALLAAAQWFAPARMAPIRSAIAAVAGITCNAVVTDVNFGNVGTPRPPGHAVIDINTSTTGYLTYYCTNTTATPQSITACISLGSPGGKNPRQVSSGGNSMNYNLFQDAAGTIPWGSIYRTTWGTARMVPISVPANGTSAPTTLPIYATITANQSTQAGTYTDTYGQGDVAMDVVSGNQTTCPTSAGGATWIGFRVSATVAQTCQVTTNPLTFPPVTSTGLNTSSATASTTLTVQCTGNHTGYQVGLDNGQNFNGTRRMRGGPTFSNYINYGLYQDPQYQTAWGNNVGSNTVTGTANPQTFTVYGSVPANPTASYPAGNYFDVVTVFVYY